MIVMPCTVEAIEPPNSAIPEPVANLLIVLTASVGANTTLFTPAAIVRPFAPVLVPVPLKIRPACTAMLAAFDTVMPLSGVVLPTLPDSEIGPVVDNEIDEAPSSVLENTMPPVPLESIGLAWSVTAPL